MLVDHKRLELFEIRGGFDSVLEIFCAETSLCGPVFWPKLAGPVWF